MSDFLHPDLCAGPALDAARAAWARSRRIRLTPLLADGVPAALLQAVRARPFQLNASHFGEFNQLYWNLFFRPDDGDPVLDPFAAWLRGGLCDLVSAITGRALVPTSTGQAVSTLYGYGCYLDIHNDGGNGRSVAFVLGLTPGAWPPEEGGHLEFLAPRDRGLAVSERRAPGWNTLDLFDVAEDPPLHRIPMVTGQHERRAFSGWFYTPA